MSPEQIAKALEPHAKRPIRAFLARPIDPASQKAFWDTIFDQRPQVDHQTACRVADELEASQRPVRDVLEGWRPEALA